LTEDDVANSDEVAEEVGPDEEAAEDEVSGSGSQRTVRARGNTIY